MFRKGEAVYEWEDEDGLQWPYEEKPKQIPTNKLSLKFCIRANGELTDYGSVPDLMKNTKWSLRWAAYAELPETLRLLMEAKKYIKSFKGKKKSKW